MWSLAAALVRRKYPRLPEGTQDVAAMTGRQANKNKIGRRFRIRFRASGTGAGKPVHTNDRVDFAYVRPIALGIDEDRCFQRDQILDGGIDSDKIPEGVDNRSAAVARLKRDIYFESSVSSKHALGGEGGP